MSMWTLWRGELLLSVPEIEPEIFGRLCSDLVKELSKSESCNKEYIFLQRETENVLKLII
jgi:hypothetical protein